MILILTRCAVQITSSRMIYGLQLPIRAIPSATFDREQPDSSRIESGRHGAVVAKESTRGSSVNYNSVKLFLRSRQLRKNEIFWKSSENHSRNSRMIPCGEDSGLRTKSCGARLWSFGSFWPLLRPSDRHRYIDILLLFTPPLEGPASRSQSSKIWFKGRGKDFRFRARDFSLGKRRWRRQKRTQKISWVHRYEVEGLAKIFVPILPYDYHYC